MSSVAHSFQDRTDLQIGSPSVSGELPTEIGLLTSLSEYRTYRMIESLHVERAHFLYELTSYSFLLHCSLRFLSLLTAYLGAIISSPTLPTEVGSLTNLSTSQPRHLALSLSLSLSAYAPSIQFVSPSRSSLFVHTGTFSLSLGPSNSVFPSIVLSLSNLSKLMTAFFFGSMLVFAFRFQTNGHVHRTSLIYFLFCGLLTTR